MNMSQTYYKVYVDLTNRSSIFSALSAIYKEFDSVPLPGDRLVVLYPVDQDPAFNTSIKPMLENDGYIVSPLDTLVEGKDQYNCRIVIRSVEHTKYEFRVDIDPSNNGDPDNDPIYHSFAIPVVAPDYDSALTALENHLKSHTYLTCKTDQLYSGAFPNPRHESPRQSFVLPPYSAQELEDMLTGTVHGISDAQFRSEELDALNGN